MNIYRWLNVSDEYAVVDAVSKDDFEAFLCEKKFDTVKEPVNLHPVYDDRRKLPLGDFPSTTATFPKCLSTRAYVSLKHLIDSTTVVKKAKIDNETYYLIWPKDIIDCLDISQSDISETITGFKFLEKAKFKPNITSAESIFRVPEFATQCIFVTDIFLDTARKAQLKGLELQIASNDYNAEIISI